MSYHGKSVFFVRYYSPNFASPGDLVIDKYRISTPILWISYEFYSPRGLWKYVKNIRGILVNAHNIEHRKSLTTQLYRRCNFRSLIGFQGYVMLDSGGIKFARCNEEIRLNNIFELANRIRPDIMISPDYPISPCNSCVENKIRVTKTIITFAKALKFAEEKGIVLMPVIHGYNLSDIDHMLRGIQRITKTNEINIIGIGSLVPLLVPFTLDKAKTVLDLILHLRKKLPNAFIHVFGMGSILTMHLAFLAGADSVDSQSWVRSAGYGKIQIPGNGQLFVKKEQNKYKFEQWSKEAPVKLNCDCPICSFKGKESLARSKRFRAIHNAYALCSEAQMISRMMRSGEYVEFVKERLKKTVLFKLFKYLIDRTRF